MVNTIRTSTGYHDEYILAKPVKWVRNTYEMCIRDIYNNNLQLSHLVLHLYASSMSKEVPPPKVFEEMMNDARAERESKSKNWFGDDTKLSTFGISVKKPKTKDGGSPANPPKQKVE